MYYCNYFNRDENDENNEEEYMQCPIPPCCPYYKQYLDKAPTSEYRNDFPRQSSPPGPPPKTIPQKGQMQGMGGPGKGGGPQGTPQGMGHGNMPFFEQFMPPFGKGGPQVKAVDPGAIRPCIHKYVYIWPRRGPGFWSWLTDVGRKSVSGYKWRGYRWVYFGMDLRDIDNFECY